MKQRRVRPTGTEGYRTTEMTVGGVDTSGLDGVISRIQNRSVRGATRA